MQSLLLDLSSHFTPAADGQAPPTAPPTAPPAASLALTQRDRVTMATITPPQSLDSPVRATCGAHCLVIDVSYSMEASATVKSTTGDDIDHGFSLLDIAKHATCTYVASLADDDWVSVACYATEARMVIGWTEATEQGKEALLAAIRSLKEEGSTNLTAGIGCGFRIFEEELPPPVAANPSDYAMLLAVATDGRPNNNTHPPGGLDGYSSLVQERSAAVAAAHGSTAAAPAVVAIGLGNDLDSSLLLSFSDAFLHIPDPGSVAPFMVNLLAATRSTARVATDSGAVVAANRTYLRVSPASAVASVPGWGEAFLDGEEVVVPIGALLFDQPRHILIVGADGAEPLACRLTVEGSEVAACSAARLLPAAGAEEEARFCAEVERTCAVCALALQERRLSLVDRLLDDDVAQRLAREGGRVGDLTFSLVWNDESDLDLWVTMPSGEKVFYSNKKSRCGAAELDVDMNASHPKSKEPVENVYVGDAEAGVVAPAGKYKVEVNNYAYHSSEGLPEPREIAFRVQVRLHGDTTDYTGVVRAAKDTVAVCEIEYAGRAAGGGGDALERERMAAARARKAEETQRLRQTVPPTLLEEATALLSAGPLKETLTDEALLATQPAKFRAWGRHYLTTLPQMLRAERRSNFRDACLQLFGRDASGREALFDSLSSESELAFARLAPPQPSNLERIARTAAAQCQRASAYTSMPEEFMRGGGCFAPEAEVLCVEGDGSEQPTPVAGLVAGSQIRTPGGVATVRCVVESACDGGVATLTELPGGLQLTEWHPVLDGSGKWRFPHILGRRVARRCGSVFNLVLASEHVAIVGGVPCATLGHGLRGPVVGHPFWGTNAVIELLRRQPGWEAGRVFLAKGLHAA